MRELETWILLGAYPALRGFMEPVDVAAVLATAQLADGTAWPVPVTVVIPPAVALRARRLTGNPGRGGHSGQ